MDTLELKVEEAQKRNLGYLVFLEMLLEDENNRRSQEVLSGRLRRARFEESKTLSDFDFTYNPEIPASLIRDLGKRFKSGVVEGISGVFK
ncbi:MAG: ATP-binding protein, partial [Bacillota bacterium]